VYNWTEFRFHVPSELCITVHCISKTSHSAWTGVIGSKHLWQWSSTNLEYKFLFWRNTSAYVFFVTIVWVTLWSLKLIQIIFKNWVLTTEEIQHTSITRINWLMLFREIIAVCSENHMKPISTLCGQNEESVNVKAGGTYS
jgi:hypothetical protein